MRIRQSQALLNATLPALKKIQPVATATAVGLSLLIGSAATADDLDVFTAGLNEASKPNILFVLDYSGSMNWDLDGQPASQTNQPARIDILRDAVQAVLAASADFVNMGMGPLYSWSSGGVQWPISNVSDDASTIDPTLTPGQFTNGDVINSLLASRQAGNGTATVSALAEAALYFRGGNVAAGGASTEDSNKFTPQVWSNANARYQDGFYLAPSTATYSPNGAYQANPDGNDGIGYCSDYRDSGGGNFCEGLAVFDCQVRASGTPNPYADDTGTNQDRTVCKYNHPDVWQGANYNTPITSECQKNYIVLITDGEPTVEGNYDAIEEVTGMEASTCEDLSNSIFNEPANTKTAGNCGLEVARELAQNDQNPAIPGSNVRTYTVGFSIDGPGKDYLRALAAAGDGEFFEANRPEDLSNALAAIIDEILGDSENFAEVSVDINKATFSSDDRLYFPLFKPSLKPSWTGNVKGYFLDDEGIKDVNGNPATIDGDTGTIFSDNSKSFWTDQADGNKVLEGGLSGRLDPDNRNLYTYTGPTDNINGNGIKLSASVQNRIVPNNGSIDYNRLQIPVDPTIRSDIFNWIKEQPIGAPLHSKIQTVDYANGRRVLYTITNQGFLHAFDVSRPAPNGVNDTGGGEELFAFMPKELLKNLNPMRTGVSTDAHIYGLDGSITRWHDDGNSDGVVNNGESVLLVFGMRRGGNSYYAIEVGNPEDPRFMWQIEGGQGQFQKLAQTWSRPSLIRVNNGTTDERVLVFGGGYDPTLDDKLEAADSSGNSIFMVNRGGDYVWSAADDEMTHAIPSDIAAFDSDNDGKADRLYVGDLGGQLWRVDFDSIAPNSIFHINKIADVSDRGYQPFYYPPSVAYHWLSGQSYSTVAIGSGNRDNPSDPDSQNAFFVFKDENYQKGAPANVQVITGNALHNATDNPVASTNSNDATTARNELRDGPGWRIDLLKGEKALSKTVTFNGRLLATTYQPGTPEEADACGKPASRGRFYMMDVITGEPVIHLGDADPNDPLDKTHRSTVVSTWGIPSTPVVVFPQGSTSAQVLVNKELVGEIDQSVKRVYWFVEH